MARLRSRQAGGSQHNTPPAWLTAPLQWGGSAASQPLRLPQYRLARGAHRTSRGYFRIIIIKLSAQQSVCKARV